MDDSTTKLSNSQKMLRSESMNKKIESVKLVNLGIVMKSFEQFDLYRTGHLPLDIKPK